MPFELSKNELEELRRQSLLLPPDPKKVRYTQAKRTNPRLAIYVRRSLETDTSVSLARQEAALKAMAVKLGGTFDPETDVYIENGVTASGKKFRPALEVLLRRIDRYDGLLVWEFSRLSRSPRETSIIRTRLLEHGCEIYSHEEAWVTLFGPTAFLIEILAQQGQEEINKTSARVTDSNRFKSTLGLHRGGAAPFGMVTAARPSQIGGRTAAVQVLVPDERPIPATDGVLTRAGVVREAARRILDGDSAGAVARWAAAAGVPSPRGGVWSSGTVTRMLRNPALIGQVIHHGRVVSDSTTTPPSGYEPVLDTVTWVRLQSLWEAPRPVRRGPREALLRGLVRCGHCAAPMSIGASNTPNPVYVCRHASMQGKHVCIGNAISARSLEAFVEQAVLAVLADPGSLADAAALQRARAAAENAEGAARSACDQTRLALDRLDVERARGEYDDPDGERRYSATKRTLLAQLAVAERTLRRHESRLATPAPSEMLQPDLPIAEAYALLPVGRRRTLIGRLVEVITITPSVTHNDGKRVRRFQADRIHLRWHTTDTA